MNQHFSRPDWYIRPSGHLDAVVTEQRITPVPPFMRGLRALFVSDVHVLNRTTPWEIDALTELMARQSPDLLLLGGDYSDTAEGALRLFEAWKRLDPPLGCYGVIGNNDAEAWADRRALRQAMANFGAKLLVNQCKRLSIGGGALYLAGVDEHRYGAPHSEGLYPPRPSKNTYRILLSHYPCRPAVPPDLMLSGHTHGGQFNALGLTPFVIGFERYKRPPRASMAIAGLRDVGGMKLLVSKGIGASRLQLRVGVRPEINLLRFE